MSNVRTFAKATGGKDYHALSQKDGEMKLICQCGKPSRDGAVVGLCAVCIQIKHVLPPDKLRSTILPGEATYRTPEQRKAAEQWDKRHGKKK